MAIATKNPISPFSPQHMEAICKVLGHTESGLTGTEIGYLLQDSRVSDVDPGITKWKRLFNAFIAFQNEHRTGNHVIVLITRAMNPANYTDRPDVFSLRRDKLNAVLAFCGFNLREDGKITRGEPSGHHRAGIGTGQPSASMPNSAQRPSRCPQILHGRTVGSEFLPRRL